MITAEKVVSIHGTLSDQQGAPAVDLEKLRAVLAKPLATQSGLPRYPTLFNKVAVLMQGLVFERPFTEANRETAVQCARLLLERHGYALSVDETEFDRLAKGIELGFTTWQRITVWIKKNTTRQSPP